MIRVLLPIVVLTLCEPAQAIPPFLAGFERTYVADRESEFGQKVAAARCNVCHAGTSKKQFNEYGLALTAVLDRSRFGVARLKSDPQGVQQEINNKLRYVAATQSSFGERIKAGELPAK